MQTRKTLAEVLKESEAKRIQTKRKEEETVIHNATIDPLFIKDNGNFKNLKTNIALSIWYGEECFFKPLMEGGFLVTTPTSESTLTHEEWSALLKKITVWVYNNNIYCTCKEMKDKLLANGFVSYSV